MQEKIKRIFYYYRALFVFFVGILTCCSLNQNQIGKSEVADYKEQSIDTSSKTTLNTYRFNSCEDLILQVITIRQGMTYPKGTVVDIRVMKDGELEYDDYRTGEHNVSVVRKRKKLSKPQLTHLLEILDSKELNIQKSEYQADYYCCDVFMQKKFDFCSGKQKKELLINEYDVLIHTERKDKLPVQLIKLIKFVDEITGKISPSITH